MISTIVLALALQESGPSVTLRSEAVVETDYVRLIDVAAGVRAGGAVREALDRVYLGRAPEAGGSRLVTAGDVSEELERRGLTGVSVAGGPVRVERGAPGLLAAQSVLANRIAFEIRLLAARELGDLSPNDVGVSLAHVDPAPEGSGLWFRRVVRSGTRLLGTGEYLVELQDPAAASPLTLRAVARVCRRRPAAVALHEMARGAKVSSVDFRIEAVESDETEGYVFDVHWIAGGKTLRKVAAGEVLRHEAVKLRVMVRKGDRVRATSSWLAIDATALEEGSAGDVIQLEAGETKKQFSGRVLSASEVEILEN